MGLHQTLQQILEAREGNAAAAASATESAAQMRQHERAVAAMLDRIERATAATWWDRLVLAVVVAVVGGLVAGLVVAAIT